MRTVAFLIILLPAVAEAAKKKKQEEAPPPAAAAPVVEEKPKPAPKKEEEAPYDHTPFGTMGAATLNGESGLRVAAFGGNHTFGDGYGYGGVDALYIVGGTGKNVDLGFGLRFGAYPLGVAPQAELRWRVAQASFFHFGLHLGLAAPLAFRGMVGGFTYAAQAEVGVLFSFFINDHQELFVDLLAAGTLLFSGLYIPVPQAGFTARVGYVYTFLKPGIGIFFAPEVTPGFYAPFGAPTLVGNIAQTRVAAGFLIAFNFRLGVQVRF